MHTHLQTLERLMSKYVRGASLSLHQEHGFSRGGVLLL